MRVGIITDHPFAAALGYSVRPRELSKNLARLGCEVHVFSPVDSNLKLSKNLIIHGLPVKQIIFAKGIHTFIRRIFKNSFTARYFYRKKIFELLSNQLVKNLQAKVEACKIEILQGEKEIASMAAAILGKRLGIPSVADFHGLLVEEAVQSKFMVNNSKEYFETKTFVSEVLCESDTKLVVSDNLKLYFRKNYDVKGDEFFVIPNAGTPRKYMKSPNSEQKNMVYAGILESWERVDLAIASIPHVIQVHPEGKLFIAGAGSLECSLTKLAKQLDINTYVKFVGLIPYRNVNFFLSKADVALLPSTVDAVRNVACPIKLFEYLAMGLPVVTVEGLWWSDFVKQNNVGFVAKDDPENFAAAINELLSNPLKTKVMGKNAVRLIADKYNWFEIAKKLLKVYEKIM